ncbi:Replication factor A protein 1 [Sorochytrium milnesiophthora]
MSSDYEFDEFDDDEPLSTGCLQDIITGTLVPKPVVQVLDIKRVVPKGDKGERYRLIVSDGNQYAQALLDEPLNHFCAEGIIAKLTVIRLTKYSTFVNGLNCRIILAAAFELVANMEKIGRPRSFNYESSEYKASLAPAAEGEAGPSSSDNSSDNTSGNDNGRGDAVDALSDAMQQQSLQSPHKGMVHPRVEQDITPDSGKDTASESSAQDSGVSSSSVSNTPTPAPEWTTVPIPSLNPYSMQWTIRARVQNKSDVRLYQTQKGSGKLFTCVLFDESGEIQATAWQGQVDRLFPMLEVGRVYTVSCGRIQVASRFNRANSDYELVFDASTVVASMRKREIEIVDASCRSVLLTLWDERADNFSGTVDSVLAARNVKVGDFGGRTLSLLSTGVLMVNPDTPEAHELQAWYSKKGRTAEFTPYSNAIPARASGVTGGSARTSLGMLGKTLAQAQKDELGKGEQPDYFECEGTITSIRSDRMIYPACPTQGCGKKIFEQHGQWRCEKCRAMVAGPEYRYIFSFAVADPTGQIWMQCFNDMGTVIMGRTAAEMHQLQIDDIEAFSKAVQAAVFTQHLFRVRAKTEYYNDEYRVRYSAVKVSPLTDNATILKHIKELNSSIDAYEALEATSSVKAL